MQVSNRTILSFFGTFANRLCEVIFERTLISPYSKGLCEFRNTDIFPPAVFIICRLLGDGDIRPVNQSPFVDQSHIHPGVFFVRQLVLFLFVHDECRID